MFLLQVCDNIIGSITVNEGVVAAMIAPITPGRVCVAESPATISCDAVRVRMNSAIPGKFCVANGTDSIDCTSDTAVIESDPLSYHKEESIDLMGNNLTSVRYIIGASAGSADIIIETSAAGDLILRDDSRGLHGLVYDADGDGRLKFTAIPGSAPSVFVADSSTPPAPVELGTGSSRVARFSASSTTALYMVQIDASGNRLEAVIPVSNIFRADGSVTGTGNWLVNNLEVQGNLTLDAETLQITGTIQAQQVNDSTIHDLEVTGTFTLDTASSVTGGVLYDDGTGLILKTTAPSTGDALKWTGTQWHGSKQFPSMDIDRIGTSQIDGDVFLNGTLSLDDGGPSVGAGATLYMADANGLLTVKAPCALNEVLLSSGAGAPVCSPVVTAEVDPQVDAVNLNYIAVGTGSAISATIVPGTDGHPLLSGSPPGFGQVDTVGIADNAVTLDKAAFIGTITDARLCEGGPGSVMDCDLAAVTAYETDPQVDAVSQYSVAVGTGSAVSAAVAPSPTVGYPMLSNGSSSNPGFGQLETVGLADAAVTIAKTDFIGTVGTSRICEGQSGSSIDCLLTSVAAYEDDPESLHRSGGSNVMGQDIVFNDHGAIGVNLIESPLDMDLVLQANGSGDVRVNVGTPVQYGLMYDTAGDGSTGWSAAPSNANPQVPLGTNAAPLTWVEVGTGASRLARFDSDAAVGSALCQTNSAGTFIKCTEALTNLWRSDGTATATANWDLRPYKLDVTDLEVHGTLTLDGNTTTLETAFEVFNSSLFVGDRLDVTDIDTTTIDATGDVTYSTTALSAPVAGALWQARDGNGLGGWSSSNPPALYDVLQWSGTKWHPTSTLEAVTIAMLSASVIQARNGTTKLVIDGSTGTGIRLHTGTITAGSLMYSNTATGDLAFLTPGTSGHLVTSGGAGNVHTYTNPTTLFATYETDPSVANSLTAFQLVTTNSLGTELENAIPFGSADHPLVSNGAGQVATHRALPTNGLEDLAVTEAKIANGAVTGTKIASSTITDANLASSSVVEAKIATGAVTEGKIGTGAVTEAKIGTGAVTNTKLGAGAVTSDKIASATITETNIATSFYEEGSCNMVLYGDTSCSTSALTLASTSGNYDFCRWSRVGRAVTLTVGLTRGTHADSGTKNCVAFTGDVPPPCITGGGTFACGSVVGSSGPNWINADRISNYVAIDSSSHVIFYTLIDASSPTAHGITVSDAYRFSIAYNTD